MLSKVSEDAPRNHHASVLTGLSFTLLLFALFTFSSSLTSLAQTPIDLNCGTSTSFKLTLGQIFNVIPARACVTIVFNLNGGCQPEPFCCHPENDPICGPTLCPTNDCCCWNELWIKSASTAAKVYTYKWRGCDPQGQKATMSLCLDQGEYYLDYDMSTWYHCNNADVTVTCPGCCP